ncbi:phage integrase Arm DNA-binding domain-containing protein [Stutzerimonas chloritidismutans]|uniref:phage integrase Arm DNA-binding domain-containing protein n=1 Tax=Stutzerimonas chloritidismutans TaxID=203192 RepID=UPI00384B7373
MSRPRKKANRDLPLNLYYSKDTKSYRYKDTIKNKWHKFGHDRQKAIKSAQILNAKLMVSRDLIEAVMAEHTLTLRQFIDDYREKVLPEKKLKAATLDLYKIRHRQIGNALGDKPLNMITLKQISDFLDGFSPRASNQTRASLIDLFNHAVARGLLESNVAAKTMKRSEDKQRKRHTKEGIKAIREHAPQWLKNAIDLALVISQRRCDLLNLRFDGIKDGYMYLIQQKTGDQTDSAWLKLEITPAFQKVIDQCRDDVDSPFLIHRKPDRKREYANKEHPTQITGHYLSTEFKKARDAARCYPQYGAKEMPGLHEIRGTSLKMYQMAGKDAQKIAGHASPDMTLNYLKGHEFAEWVEVSPDLDISEFTDD